MTTDKTTEHKDLRAHGAMLLAMVLFVPMVSYPDHNPHSVDIIITDQGIADLRGKDPVQSAHEIIEYAAHPVYRPLLREYLTLAKKGHVMMNPDIAFAMHSALMHDGDMRKTDFAKFMK